MCDECVVLARRIEELERRFAGLAAENASLRAEKAALQADVVARRLVAGLSSRNSSLPPSTDRPGDRAKRKAEAKRKQQGPPKGKGGGNGGGGAAAGGESAPSAKRKRGGQPGHVGTTRVDATRPECTIRDRPSCCPHCQAVIGADAEEAGSPFVVKVWDYLRDERRFSVVEHDAVLVVCPSCARLVRGPIPPKVFGSGLAALVATLTKVLDGATRKVRAWLGEAVGLDLSEASIVGLCAEAGRALQPYRDQALAAIRQARVVGLDETRWMDRGVDCTAWVADDRLGHVVLSIQPDRSGVHADELLGDGFDGIVMTDRYSGYDHLPTERRGVCHGHLTRNFRRAGRVGILQASGAGPDALGGRVAAVPRLAPVQALRR